MPRPQTEDSDNLAEKGQRQLEESLSEPSAWRPITHPEQYGSFRKLGGTLLWGPYSKDP